VRAGEDSVVGPGLPEYVQVVAVGRLCLLQQILRLPQAEHLPTLLLTVIYNAALRFRKDFIPDPAHFYLEP
jgi:hypothetical protein